MWDLPALELKFQRRKNWTRNQKGHFSIRPLAYRSEPSNSFSPRGLRATIASLVGQDLLMRSRAGTIDALIAALMLALVFGAGLTAAPSMPPLAQNSGVEPVDVELVLAVDVSYSMDPDEQELQREGYVQALTSRDFMQALRLGMHGKIALT